MSKGSPDALAPQAESPFAQPGGWHKGQLHVHSTASDGELTSDGVIGWYRARGYHFLALTDHGVLSEARAVADDFITLSGIEVDGVDPQRGLYHLVALGLGAWPEVGTRESIPAQEAIQRLRAAGGLVFMAHPYWSGQMSKDLLDQRGCLGLEVFNGGCEVDNGRGYSTVHWDDLLAAGYRLWGLAVDDAHWRDGDHDAGLGWVWVKAAALTQAAILDALQRGRFYASSGPEIHDVWLEANQVHIRCSPVVAIDFMGNGPLSRRLAAPPGGTLTGASLRVRSGQRYVRVACVDADGHWAWTNPFFLEGGGPR
jgi:hypothetical protein